MLSCIESKAAESLRQDILTWGGLGAGGLPIPTGPLRSGQSAYSHVAPVSVPYSLWREPGMRALYSAWSGL